MFTTYSLQLQLKFQLYMLVSYQLHLIAALMLGLCGSLYLSTSTYSAGPAALLSSTGYVANKDWWKLSAIIGVTLNIIWSGGGLLWTKVLGMW